MIRPDLAERERRRDVPHPALLPYLSEESLQRTPTRGEASGIAFFALHCLALGLVGLSGELNRPQHQLLLHIGLRYQPSRERSTACQFTEITAIRHRCLPDRSQSWTPKEGGLFPLNLGSASQKPPVREISH